MKGLLGFVIGGAGGLLIGIIIGVIAATGFGYWQSGGVNIPYDQNHNRIAESFVIRDVTYGATLSRKHLQTGPIEFSPTAPFSSYFPAHLQTTQSVWAFCSGDDIDIILIILGPGNDTRTYSLNFQRLAANEISISSTLLSVSVRWPGGESPARQEFEVHLP
jgi:hypothetical protein